ncbi:MAG TPA: alpha/beta hydrolase [Methylibium sp.]|uniref:alpha/beta fold hydrolase n=1 Tax=Methylibium sp. TaxID=2067992 RepID=UPI002DB6CD6D|nr:alpha/beta hydrolase [Methylibium sp.]HEU4458828.1 alpha/beta hydrolase [Methylibium sp.]
MKSGALPAAVSGEHVQFDGPAGRLGLYIAGEGEPLLLVHSVNAAASAAELRPLHEHYAHAPLARRCVYSLDLPGFGSAERSDRAYTPRLMTEALHAAVECIRRRSRFSGAIDALALSLSCEFLARAAAESPADFRSLALVSPTGFSGLHPRRGAPGSTLGKPALLRALRGPRDLWGEALFRGLTRPKVIRYFLRRTWGAREIDEALWRYDVISARQPGAHFAPLHFLAGCLFSADIQAVYESLVQPVWMSHGIRGDFTDYRGARIVEGRDNWQIQVFPTGALPHFEVLPGFTASYDRFLAKAGRVAAVEAARATGSPGARRRGSSGG